MNEDRLKLGLISKSELGKKEAGQLKFEDFLIALVAYKREHHVSCDFKTIYSDRFILRLLDIQMKFVEQESVLKIFTVARRFRLFVLYYRKSKAEFKVG